MFIPVNFGGGGGYGAPDLDLSNDPVFALMSLVTGSIFDFILVAMVLMFLDGGISGYAFWVFMGVIALCVLIALTFTLAGLIGLIRYVINLWRDKKSKALESK